MKNHMAVSCMKFEISYYEQKNHSDCQTSDFFEISIDTAKIIANQQKEL